MVADNRRGQHIYVCVPASVCASALQLTQHSVWARSTAPPGITAQALACELTPTKLTLGLKGNPPFIDVRGSASCLLC
jgi:hypothetical protein